MKASQLIAQLSTIIAEHGDLVIIGQADCEGNSYDTIRGAAFAYVNDDLDSTVDTELEAEEYGDYSPCIVVYP